MHKCKILPPLKTIKRFDLGKLNPIEFLKNTFRDFNLIEKDANNLTCECGHQKTWWSGGGIATKNKGHVLITFLICPCCEEICAGTND